MRGTCDVPGIPGAQVMPVGMTLLPPVPGLPVPPDPVVLPPEPAPGALPVPPGALPVPPGALPVPPGALPVPPGGLAPVPTLPVHPATVANSNPTRLVRMERVICIALLPAATISRRRFGPAHPFGGVVPVPAYLYGERTKNPSTAGSDSGSGHQPDACRQAVLTGTHRSLDDVVPREDKTGHAERRSGGRAAGAARRPQIRTAERTDGRMAGWPDGRWKRSFAGCRSRA